MLSSKTWITQDIIHFWKIFSVCYAEQTSLENSKLKSKGFSYCRYSWIFQYVHLPKGVQHIQPCSLFFTATCRILLLSYKFGKCWNKLYSAFQICIYPDTLKSLSLLVITRNGEKERLVFNPRSPMSFFCFLCFFFKEVFIKFFIWCIWNTSNRPMFNILSSSFHTIL